MIGIALGVALALVVPQGALEQSKVLAFVAGLSIRIGRYIVVPLVFFSAMRAVDKLREERLLLKTGAWTAAMAALSSIVLVCVALVSSLAARLPRVPISGEAVPAIPSLDAKALVMSLFPDSAFSALCDGTLLLSSFLLACFFGGALAGDRSAFKNVVALVDSLSKLCYNVATLFSEMLPVCMTAIACKWALQFRAASAAPFRPLLILLLVDFAVVAAVIYPLALRLAFGAKNPWRVLYAALPSTLAALFSGDSNFVLPVNIRAGKENLGVRRRFNAVAMPFFSVFARGGSALVALSSFVLIWRSYADLAIPARDLAWAAFMSLALSFALGGFPQGGPFAALAALCAMYGRDFEAGCSLLAPAAPVICAAAAAFDALTAIFASFAVASKTGTMRSHSARRFI